MRLVGAAAENRSTGFFSALAMVISCSSDSMAQGPAMIVRLFGPISVLPTFTMLGSGWNFIESLALGDGNDVIHVRQKLQVFAESFLSPTTPMIALRPGRDVR